MDITLLILTILLSLGLIGVFLKGRLPLVVTGLKQSLLTLKAMWPRILLGLTLGGLIQALVPSSVIAEWLGPTSGLKGILIGSYAGLVMVAGGPYVTLPLVLSIYEAGAGPGPVIALLSSLNLVGIQGLIVWQIPFLGAKLAFTRYVVTFFMPPVIGIVGGALYQLLA